MATVFVPSQHLKTSTLEQELFKTFHILHHMVKIKLGRLVTFYAWEQTS